MGRPARTFDALLEEARGISKLGPLAAPGYQRRIAPFLSISALIVVGIAATGKSLVLVVLLVGGSIGTIGAASFVPWRRMPRWTQGALVVASLLLIEVVLRSTGGAGSPFLLNFLLPLVWLALYESRGWLNAGLAVTGALLLLELLPLPPTDDVLRVVALLAG
ncbi:MAG: hypothetical protein ABI083_01825, partial [Lapillicoccus sp.]